MSASVKGTADIAANYYTRVGELSVVTEASGPLRAEVPKETERASQYAILLPYAPFLISGVLFAATLFILTLGKFHTAKLTAGKLLIAVLAAAIPMVLTQMGQGMHSVSQADTGSTPKQVTITHHTPDSVVVAWETAKAEPNVLRISEDAEDMEHARLVGSVASRSTAHAVTVTKLEAGKTYGVEILSGTDWFRDGEHPVMFTFTSQKRKDP